MSLPAPIAEALPLWRPGSAALLTGKSGIFHLSHIWQTLFTVADQSVQAVDCALRFNALWLADEANRRGLQTEALLHAVLIQRAFTPYQILDIAQNILASPVAGRVYFFLAPLKQFFDSDVSDDEGIYLLKKLSKIFERMSEKKISLLIIEKDEYSHPAFASAFAQLVQISTPVWRLKSIESIRTGVQTFYLETENINHGDSGKALQPVRSLLSPARFESNRRSKTIPESYQLAGNL